MKEKKTIASIKEIISLLSLTFLKVDWEEIKLTIDSEFYVFLNHYLKLEIREIQKYIFDLIECLLKVSDEDSSSSEKIIEMLSTSVVASSLISEISVIEEDDENFENKILNILMYLLKDKRFYQVFRKNDGMNRLFQYHWECKDRGLRLIVARIMLEGLKGGIFRPFRIFAGFMEGIIREIT